MTPPTFALALLRPLLMSGLAGGADEASVEVVQNARGCFHDDNHQHEWRLVGEQFTWGDRKLARGDVAALKKTIVAARHEVPDLLAEVGVTRESLAAHRGEILALAAPETFKRDAKGGVPELPPELEPLLEWERVAPLLKKELLGRSRISTEHRLVRVTFAGDGPTVVVESESLVPWMLPWKVTVDGQTFESEDLAVPRALLQLLDPKGPCAGNVDGSSRWPDRAWSNLIFWQSYLGREMDRALSARLYTGLDGWSLASQLFTVREVMTGNVNLQPESMFFELDSKAPLAIDRARWHDLLVAGRPSKSWDDFLALHERAEACVETQHWLLDWKSSSPKRHIELQAAGTSGISETMVDFLVLPAWKDAGFAGHPEFELLLREDQRAVGTIYLSSEATGTLIVSAHPDRVRDPQTETDMPPPAAPAKDAPPHHWFDDLAFFFHPRGEPPTYGRVDADGRAEVRTMERASDRRK